MHRWKEGCTVRRKGAPLEGRVHRQKEGCTVRSKGGFPVRRKGEGGGFRWKEERRVKKEGCRG